VYNERVSWLIITFVQLTLSSGSVGGGQGTEEGGRGCKTGGFRMGSDVNCILLRRLLIK
jgi:hypothetical protein